MSTLGHVVDLLRDPLRIGRGVAQRARRLVFRHGRSVLPGTFIGHVPDRYDALGTNLDRQRTENRFYDAAGFASYVAGNAQNNRGDAVRWYFLNLTIEQLLKEGVRGDVAELGVYKGNTASILARYAERMRTRCWLFDTFEGFSDKDIEGVDAAAPTVFTDAPLQDVKRLVGSDAAIFVKGYFPESLTQVDGDPRFALVHLDCDLYKPMKAGLEYFYPRLVPGGALVMHDYMSLHWRGVERAVDDFFAGKPERLVCIPDKSGTVVVRKV